MNQTKFSFVCRYGLFLLCVLFCSTNVQAEAKSDKAVSAEKVIKGMVTKIEALYGEKPAPQPKGAISKAPTMETDIKEYVLMIKNLPDSYRIKLPPNTGIAVGDRTIFPASLRAGEDFVTIKYADIGDKISISSITLEKIRAPKRVKLLSMVFGISLTGILLLAFSGAFKNVGGGLFVGQDNRYSNSKFQLMIWIFTALFSYVTLFFERYFGSTDLMTFSSVINIPENLGILMGVSAGSFIGAKAITSSQVASGVVTKVKAGKPSLLDLITDDNKLIDLGDLQMFSWTLIGALIYLLNFYQMWLYLDPSVEISLPAVDSSLLVLTGVSQAAYIGKKLVTQGT